MPFSNKMFASYFSFSKNCIKEYNFFKILNTIKTGAKFKEKSKSEISNFFLKIEKERLFFFVGGTI